MERFVILFHQIGYIKVYCPPTLILYMVQKNDNFQCSVICIWFIKTLFCWLRHILFRFVMGVIWSSYYTPALTKPIFLCSYLSAFHCISWVKVRWLYNHVSSNTSSKPCRSAQIKIKIFVCLYWVYWIKHPCLVFQKKTNYMYHRSCALWRKDSIQCLQGLLGCKGDLDSIHLWTALHRQCFRIMVWILTAFVQLFIGHSFLVKVQQDCTFHCWAVK